MFKYNNKGLYDKERGYFYSIIQTDNNYVNIVSLKNYTAKRVSVEQFESSLVTNTNLVLGEEKTMFLLYGTK